MLMKFRNAFKFKIAPHKQKSIVKNVFGRRCPPPHLSNGALCLSTPKHNGKSCTDVTTGLIRLPQIHSNRALLRTNP